MMPYSLACCGLMKLSRSVSRSTLSTGWPVWCEMTSFIRFLM